MAEIDLKFKAAVAILVVLLGFAFYRMEHPSTTFAADGIDADWDSAARRSHEAGRPAIVLFTADWCPYCQMLHGNVLSRDDVQDELTHYSFYTVDLSRPTPQGVAHESKCGVSGIPTMIRYDANGKETDRTYYLDPGQMIAWLKAGE